jgi:hypothetical protein
MAINSVLKGGIGVGVCPAVGVTLAVAVAVAVGRGVGDLFPFVPVPKLVIYQTPKPPPMSNTPTIDAIIMVETADFFCLPTTPGMEPL